MDVREKLVELIQNADNDKNLGWYDLHDLCRGKGCAEYFADYLIAHGVTVQEWISVNNMLPKIYDKDSDWSGTVLFRTTQGHIHSGRRKFGRHRMSYWVDEADNLFFSKEEVTHWQPLPQPPKGE